MCACTFLLVLGAVGWAAGRASDL